MENDKSAETGKDKVLADLERILETMPESSRQPILELINKRKVELGLQKSGLPPAGYKLKKSRKREKPPLTRETKDSLHEIAMNVGRVSETRQASSKDIDFKEEPLKKEKKAIEEVDSYKY